MPTRGLIDLGWRPDSLPIIEVRLLKGQPLDQATHKGLSPLSSGVSCSAQYCDVQEFTVRLSAIVQQMYAA